MRARITQIKKTILVYGLFESQFEQLETLAKKENVICKAVLDTQTTRTIAQLLCDTNAPEGEALPLSGKFAVLDGFGKAEQEGIALLNQVDSSIIKAVRTPYNSSWTFAKLSEELQKEHMALKADKA